MQLQQRFTVFNNSLLILLFFKNIIKEIKLINNELTFSLYKVQYLPFVLNFLKNHYKFQFKKLVHLSVVDYYLQSNQYRFELNYILLSIKYKTRVRVKVYCGQNTIIPSVTDIFTSALWLERENWDMFGIYFFKHPDLRRILTDYGFSGYPFRKDFPLSGYVELRYDFEKKTVVYDLLELTQEYRFFEFTKPWVWNISISK